MQEAILLRRNDFSGRSRVRSVFSRAVVFSVVQRAVKQNQYDNLLM